MPTFSGIAMRHEQAATSPSPDAARPRGALSRVVPGATRMHTPPGPLTPGISVVVPVFNSEESLPSLIQRLGEVLARGGEPFEVVLVNDGSRDASWRVILELTGHVAFVRGIDLMRNYGQHNALLCGLRAARFATTVTIDDDLQNPPEEIPSLLAALIDGSDVAYGVPARGQHGLWRNLASRTTKIALSSMLGATTAPSVSAFRAFHTSLRDAFCDYRSQFVSIDVLLTWGARKFTSVTVRHEERAFGRSNYTLRRLIVHSLNMLTGFSTLPLQAASVLGFVATLFGLGVLALVVGRYFVHGVSVPGFTFLASIISIFSGAQLFSLGIIGEYLARMHFRMMERPPYAVRSDTAAPTALL
jgi:glycosyltransferase involved in cell wall biosynthesis